MFLVNGGVPPPIQIAVICLSAVKVAIPLPISVPKNLVTDPAKEMAEKPIHPSQMAPMPVNVTVAISFYTVDKLNQNRVYLQFFIGF